MAQTVPMPSGFPGGGVEGGKAEKSAWHMEVRRVLMAA